MLNQFELMVYEHPLMAAIVVALVVFLFALAVGDELRTERRRQVLIHTDGRAVRNRGKHFDW